MATSRSTSASRSSSSSSSPSRGKVSIPKPSSGALRDQLGDPTQTLYLVDISSFIFRAFFAIRSLTNRKGEPTNAVYGVATMLARLAEEAQPQFLSVVYDSKEPSFRKEVYEDYKANRSAPPDDLIPQFARIEQLITAFGISSYRQSGVEADDVIATLAKKWCAESPKHRVVLVTGDKDLMQLVDDRVILWDTLSNKIYGPAEVEEKFGVKPDQIRDYLGLVGDSSDNIPGVPSIGPKTASDLLKQFGTVDEILAAAQKGEITGKKGETLKNNEKDARLSVELATLRLDLPVQVDLEKMVYRFQVRQELVDLLRELDFHTLIDRWKSSAVGPIDSDSGATALASATGAIAEEGGTTPVEVTGKGSGAEALSDAEASEELSYVSIEKADDAHRFRCVNTRESFEDLLSHLKKSPEFGFDLETTSLNPREAELVGVAICYDREFGCYIPVGHRGTEVEQLDPKYVLEKLKPFLEDPKYKKIGQNLKYDFSVLQQYDINADGIGADTMVADYVLSPEGRHNLETLALKYLNYTVKTYEEVCGKGKDQIGFDQVPVDQATRYSAEDAWIAVRLWEVMRPKLEKQGLMRVFAEVDLPLVNVLRKMECFGVEIDTAWLEHLSKEFDRELKAIEKKVQEHTKEPINLNSPKQLAKLLFEDLKLPPQGKTKTGYSTDASVLEALADMHEIPKLLLEYREISKLKGTYVDPLPLLRDKKTGRIHATFNQTVAATGRLSGSDPNLQNIPIRSARGQKIRRAFIAAPGNVLVSADYSQIELRLLAHMSGDKELVRSFNADEDVHRRTASEIFGIAPETVDDRQRSIAKAINFGLMYGKSAFGLSQELKIPRKEAQETIDRYFKRYSGVKYFLDGLIQEARERGYVTTLLGRKRSLPEINSRNHMMKNNAERMAMNTPIQGTAADLMKIAMIRLDEALERSKTQAKFIIQVHDEVVLECPESQVDEVRKIVIEAMEGAMELSVPLKVNAASALNWEEL